MTHALIVEDDADSAETMAALIASQGFTVATARTLRDARRQIILQLPDLVLLDLQLPDLDGMEVLKRLRAHEALRDTPIIVLSASAMPGEIALARSRGATDYWTKPLDFEHFLAGIANALGRVPVS